jgi:hypothetical protein
MTIIKEQFRALRDGDSFLFRIDPTLTTEEIESIENSRLSDIIRRNTNLKAVQGNVFVMTRTCNDVEIEEKHLETLVFPNPISGSFDLTMFSFENGKATMTIRNMMGQELVSKALELKNGVNTFDEYLNSNIPPGQYTLQVQMGYELSTTKIFKLD